MRLKQNIQLFVQNIKAPYRLLGYWSLGAVAVIYHFHRDDFQISLLIFGGLYPIAYVLHMQLILSLKIRYKKWNLPVLSTAIDTFVFLLTLLYIQFNFIISFFATIMVLYAIYINYKKTFILHILSIVFLITLVLVGYGLVDIKKDVEEIESTKFILYLFILTTFVFSGIYLLSEKMLQGRKRELEYKKQLTHYMDFAQQISHYTPPQLWQAILRGEYQAKVEYKRKKLTIFFSDIQGFTELSEKLIAEDLAYILNEYLAHMTMIATRYNATIDKFMGDGILLFFGDMDSQGIEKDARNCVDMAIAMRQQMKILRERWKQMGHPALHIRMGISTGYCHVGNYGSGERMAYTLVGREVNLASRIQSNASVDEILLSDSTYQLVSNDFLCIEKEPLRYKGIAEPIRTWQVVERYESSSPYNTHQWFDFEYKGFHLILDLNEVKHMEYNLLINTLEEMVARIKLQDKLTNKDGIVELTEKDKIVPRK